MKADVIICTKDRPKMVRFAVNQAYRKIPVNKIIIVDASEKPSKPTIVDDYIHVPDLKLGASRQAGLLASECDLVIYLDDDLILAPDWFLFALQTIDSEKNVAVVSGKILFGYKTDKAIEKLFAFAQATFSGGCMLMKREKVLSAGGWDPTMHWGEDAELYHRLLKYGLKWKVEEKSIAHHQMSLRQYFHRSHIWGIGLAETYKRHQYSPLTSLLLRRLGAIVIRPVMLALKVHPKLLIYYSISRTLYLRAFTKALKGFHNQMPCPQHYCMDFARMEDKEVK